MTSVLVTRPQPDAGEFAHSLQNKGLQAIVSPLLEISFADKEPDIPAGATHFAFTSVNGLRALDDVPKEYHLPVFCVGERTALAAKQAGFEIAGIAKGTVKNLADVIYQAVNHETDFIAHIGGRHLTDDLTKLLAAQQIKAEHIIAYEAVEADNFSAEAIEAIKSGMLDWASFFSIRTANRFISLLKENNLMASLERLKIATISEPVAKAFAGYFCAALLAANKPEKAAVIDIILGHRTLD